MSWVAKHEAVTTVEDSCQCGAVVSLTGPNAVRVTDQHDMWLEHHAPCQEWHDHWWERLHTWIKARRGEA